MKEESIHTHSEEATSNRNPARQLTRRKFLQRSSAAGVGLSLASPSLRGQQNEGGKKKELRVAIIGCGAMAEVLRSASSKIEGVRFAAVCDIRTAGIKSMRGRIHASRMGTGEDGKSCAYYYDAKKMFAEEKDLDAVLIATPDYVHHVYTRMAAEAGCHVYCESMMSNTIEGAADMVRAQREHGVLVQIGHECRSDPRYLHAKNHLIDEAKLLGWITNAYAQWHRPCSASQPRPIPKKKRHYIKDETLVAHGYKPGVAGMFELINWRMYKQFGSGLLSDLGAQQLDIFNWFFEGEPKSIYATGGSDFHTKEYITKLVHRWVDEDAREAVEAGETPTIEKEVGDALKDLEFGYEHPDSLMVILEYDTPRKRWGTEAGTGDTLTSRAYYEVLTMNSSQHFYERFMGEFGTLHISQDDIVDNIDVEAHADKEQWDAATKGNTPLITKNPKEEKDGPEPFPFMGPAPATYKSPVEVNEPAHTPHLRNFYMTVMNGGSQEDLNCPVEIAYRSTVAILKIHESIEKGTKIELTPEDYALPK